ncbi:hypothetical protein H6P81_020283 [Aristolochia fimbriata]|uniref:rhamnogalacturonan endolyase n=1 Tax=Aristolochia fimbriata TaxID=158543 RepID=A0AAV7DYI5_ARIFI|nr:hypothetical protein H6P81_020283 [Aristolochia fimbriata]
MEMANREPRWVYLFFIVSMVLMVACRVQVATAGGVHLRILGRHVEIDNGIVTLTLLNPEGSVTRIRYNGIDNLMQLNARETNRGYWDLVWNDPNQGRGSFDVILGTEFTVIRNDEEQVEVSFRRTWNPSLTGTLVPLNIDKRFVMLRDSSGFYSYAIYDRPQGWPGFELSQTRLTFKLRADMFQYAVADDTRHNVMPMPEDRNPPRGQTLDYKEAVLLVNPINPALRGTVDDKYQFSIENKDSTVHGWICNNPGTGFWLITPSQEFRSGGPMKQELTSHAGPTTLAVFQSGHYSGERLQPNFQTGEPWKKVFGPVFLYLNRGQGGAPFPSLWEDAKRQAYQEEGKWPYTFPLSPDFPHAAQRGAVNGRLLVRDTYANGGAAIPAASAHIGLALPGEAGSWQTESKGYQFWTRAGPDGSFSIRNARTGTYNLYAFVPGYIGDYRHYASITVTPGGNIFLGDLVYEPPRNGPTLWEIGVPDREALEFFVPDPSPRFFNSFLTAPKDRIRQYGLWNRYTEVYPNGDPIYVVGTSDYRRDWFYAHVSRRTADGGFLPSTRQIRFTLNGNRPGSYTIWVAIASSNFANIQIRVNNLSGRPVLSRSLAGRDNAIARHGLHGLQELYSASFPSSLLVPGVNSLFITQTRTGSPFQGFLYDYIRLEGPPM